MIRYRTLLVAAGYPGGNDCDGLTSDPAFKMAVGRLPESGKDVLTADDQPARKPPRRNGAQVHDGGDARRILLDLDDTEDGVHGSNWRCGTPTKDDR